MSLGLALRGAGSALGMMTGGYAGGVAGSAVSPAPVAVSFGAVAPPHEPVAYGYVDEDGEIVLLTESELAAVRAREELVAPLVVDVVATALAVEVRATFLQVVVVERGNLVTFVAPFGGEPDGVYFSYLRPGESRPRVDPGYGNAGSKIERAANGVYVVVVDTTGFRGGLLVWHLWSEGKYQKSAFGKVTIPEWPEQLL